MPPGVNVVPGVDVAVCPLLSGSTVVTGRTERKQARPFGVVGIDSTRYKRCPRIRVAERIVRRVFVGRRNRDPARRIDARRHAYHTILRDAATEEVHTAARGLHDPRVRQRAYRREVDRRTILRRDDLAAQFGQQQLGIVFQATVRPQAHTDTRGQHDLTVGRRDAAAIRHVRRGNEHESTVTDRAVRMRHNRRTLFDRDVARRLIASARFRDVAGRVSRWGDSTIPPHRLNSRTPDTPARRSCRQAS